MGSHSGIPHRSAPNSGCFEGYAICYIFCQCVIFGHFNGLNKKIIYTKQEETDKLMMGRHGSTRGVTGT
jgi:hypothetical protein